MEITYLGHSSFKLSSKIATIVIDPFDPEMVGLKFPKTQADIVTVSHDHADHNQTNFVSGVKKVLSGPGEYEIQGVSFIGLPSFHDQSQGSQRGKNTIFVIEMEGVRIAHLGDLGHTLSEKELSSLGDIDILMIPVGGEFTIGSEQAAKITRDIEPKIIIPMHYQVPGLKPNIANKLEKVDPFLSALSLRIEKLPKLKPSLANLPEDQMIALLAIKS